MTPNGFFRWPSILVGLLVVVAIVNVFEFFPVDRRASPNYRALMRYDTPDVLAIGVRDSPTISQRFGLPHALASVAPGSTLIVPSSVRFQTKDFRAKMLAFGGVGGVRELDYDARALARGRDFSDFYIATGRGGARGAPYAIAGSPEGSAEFVLLRGRKRLELLVDVTLLDAEALAEIQR